MALRYKSFVINLKSNEYRRKHILDQQERAGLNINVFEAITPETMQGLPHRYDKARTRKFTGRPLYDTEIACALSHLTLWRQLLDDAENDYYIIFEDDAIIEDNLAALIENIDFNNIDFIKFSGKIKRKKKKVQNLQGDKAVYKYSFGPLDAACYMVSKEGARRLINYCEQMIAPIDILMDRSFEHGVTIYGVYPYPVTAEFCFDQNSPFYTNIGDRDVKYADDISVWEKICCRFNRIKGSVKRKRAILRLSLDGQ